MTALEVQIVDLIREVYCVEYTGKIKVIETFDTFPGEEKQHLGYELMLALNKEEKPITISYEGSSEVFVQHIKQELLDRSLDKLNFYNGIKLYDSDEESKCKQ